MKKRMLSFMLALIFILASAQVSVFAQGSNGDGYTPYNLQWSDKDVGEASFDRQEKGEEYAIDLYLNGEIIQRMHLNAGELTPDMSNSMLMDFSIYVLEEGTYFFTVTAVDENEKPIGEKATSDEYVLGAAAEIGAPQNLNIEIIGDEVWCTWDTPSNFSQGEDVYKVFIASMYNGPSKYPEDPFAGGGNVVPADPKVSKCLLPLEAFDEGGYGVGPYIFSVQAVSGSVGDKNSSEKVYSTVAYDKDKNEVIKWPPAGNTVKEDLPVAHETPAPAQASASVAVPTASTVLVNGEEVAFGAYNIDGSNYFKLRDIAYALNDTESQFEIAWDGEKKIIAIITNHVYTPAGGELEAGAEGNKVPVATNAAILIDGAEVSPTAYNIDGNNYFKLRDLGDALGFEVGWDAEHNTVLINSGGAH
ncbi:copper amine oxidase N-terminal domain-containing protein [Tyzzerella sp. OttesenSCG-928-J15]|nr:copper amine oxidase N-terminal domain-containing protein [Tyzzerella sp. OttesenSCG-928-J15]MDL2248241.1 copper amine oxidase N-terminal domain-containing protein [Tyzzerella sp. OttesenSCG-928-J15]